MGGRELLCRLVGIGFEQQLMTIQIVGGDDGLPTMISEWHFVLLHETEDFGVEGERLVLVVDEDAADVDSHDVRAFLVRRVVSHLSWTSRSGATSIEWNLYRPSRLVTSKPAFSSTARCCDTACRLGVS